jgi:hypothetical protein
MKAMSDEKKSARDAWQSSLPEVQLPSMDEVHKATNVFYRRIWRRNAIEYAACVFVVGSFSWSAFTLEHVLQRIGSVMVVIGTLICGWQLHRRASPVHPESAGAMPIIEFARFQLARQRDALASVFWWYLLPFVPGMVAMVAGSMMLHAEQGRDSMGRDLIGIGVIVALFVGVWLLNQWGARKLQKHIDDIDALLGEQG